MFACSWLTHLFEAEACLQYCCSSLSSTNAPVSKKDYAESGHAFYFSVV